jgi:regulatory protein
LLSRGFDPQAAQEALQQLAAEGALSDERFAEALVRARVDRGYGPLRIAAELARRGVPEDLVRRQLDPHADDWAARAAQARRRHFGTDVPAEPRERARQARYLQQRGFTAEQVRASLARVS